MTFRDANVILPMYSDSMLTDTSAIDTSGLVGKRLDLFSRAGFVGRGVLEPRVHRPRSTGCVAWPEGAVSMKETLADTAWTVAFESGRATAIALDSLEGLTSTDSARRTVVVARLASMLPGDTAVAYRGIPFFVNQARSFRSPGREMLVAKASRRINQEANPREEQILLIAERDGSRPDQAFVAVYHERVSGQEEAIESSDVLAAVELGDRPTLVIIRDYGDGSVFSLLTRTTPGAWQVRWNSAYAGC
jgi:hypothetical protein